MQIQYGCKQQHYISIDYLEQKVMHRKTTTEKTSYKNKHLVRECESKNSISTI